MPYAITTLDVQPGIASYQLGGPEEWQLQAVTCHFDMTNALSDDVLYLEAHTGSGNRITRQMIYYAHNDVFVSLGPEADSWMSDNAGTITWPQATPGGDGVLTGKMNPVTLTPGCILYLYATLGIPSTGADPFASIDTGVVVRDPVLWVENTNAGLRNLPDVGNPILLGIGG